MLVVGAEVRTHLLGNGRPEIVERKGDASELHGIKVFEDLPQAILLDGLDRLERLDSRWCKADLHDAPIIRYPDPLDEAALLHPIDDAGGVAHGDVQEFGQVAHVQAAVVLEQPHDVHVGHAHAGLDKAPCARTSETRDHVVQVGHNRPDGRLVTLNSWSRINSTHALNNLRDPMHGRQPRTTNDATGEDSCALP